VIATSGITFEVSKESS